MLVEMLDQELEDQLRDIGRKLTKLPSSVDDLLALLDELEECLSKVEQSPSKSLLTALSPSMKALVASTLLKHEDTNVRVSVASCISEITRITAPEAPYDDYQMKQIFQIIVESFEMLWNASSRSYNKRISILETLGKVRSCVVMLDLECDELILDMFQHFFKVLRNHHPESVFQSMETIMSLVIQESEEIAPDLLHPILTSVKKENKDSLTWRLGERVIENCSQKLKGYLLPAVTSMGMSLSEFSKTVASTCLDASDVTKINSSGAFGKDLADGSSPENTRFETPSQALEEVRSESAFPSKNNMASEISARRNVDAHLKDDPEVFDDSSKKAEFSPPSPSFSPARQANLDHKVNEPETKPDLPPKRKRGRPKASQTPSRAISNTKGYTKSVLEESIDNSMLPSGPKEEAVAEGNPSGPKEETVEEVPSQPQDASVTVVSPSTSQGLADKVPRKRGRPAGSKNKSTPKKAPSVEQVDLDVTPSTNPVSERHKGETKVTPKSNRRAGKEGKLEKESSSVIEKGLPEESGKKKSVVTQNSTESKIKKYATETPRTTSKRKQTPLEQISQKPSDEDLGDNLVGSKIKVWWPDDQQFYEGIIESFDPTSQKHKVSYVDGDVEILLLKNERWEAIEEFTVQHEGGAPNLSTPKASSEMTRKRKAKTDSLSTSKKASQIKGGSTSIRKEGSSKSTRKSKSKETESKEAKDDTPVVKADETPKVGAKAKGIGTPKTGKSKAEKPKTESKSNDATPDTETKPEDDTSKTMQKSKIVTPKTGSKLGANGTSKEVDMSKIQQSEEGGKVELSELSKAEENEMQSGKKRRRVKA